MGLVAACLTILATVVQAPDTKAVARNLVQAGMVKTGDKVFVTGSIRDAGLMEDVAIETMKAGGQPLIAIFSEQLARRSFDEVPATYDTLTPTLDLALTQTFDVQIPIDVFENEGVFAGVPVERRVARAKANQPVTQAALRRNTRVVNLGNGLYPSEHLAQRLGVSQTELAATFWKAASVPAATLRANGTALAAKLSAGRQITVTDPNGTSITFGLDASRAIISDGAITAEKVAQGNAAATTYIPAGEYLAAATPGGANGTIVFDKVIWDGKEIRSLRLTFANGRLTAMTAASPMEVMRAAYDAAGSGKDQFGFVDIGVNPETKLPLGTGRTIWTAPGSVALGFGDNRFWGGTNASEFSFIAQLSHPTLKVDGRTVIENGQLK